MSEKNVIIYVSNNCLEGERLLKQLDVWNVSYTKKNVSNNKEYMVELQEKGVFGTPATFIGDQTVLGFQINKLKRILEVDNQTSILNARYGS
ncbi:glutaredoxin family protein [Virgibacillus byunsanensis]|uniref:Glutaredoxin family protein n=1 Tax=Virgibacillus byunsanensis TaxID=570945 RepID=A0ABW3LJ22_9BACI